MSDFQNLESRAGAGGSSCRKLSCGSQEIPALCSSLCFSKTIKVQITPKLVGSIVRRKGLTKGLTALFGVGWGESPKVIGTGW